MELKVDIIFLFFLGMRFYGVKVAPVNLYKIETSVCILAPTIIYFGADSYNWPIKFGVLVTFCVLIDYLGIFNFIEIGATNFSFASFLLSLDDY